MAMSYSLADGLEAKLKATVCLSSELQKKIALVRAGIDLVGDVPIVVAHFKNGSVARFPQQMLHDDSLEPYLWFIASTKLPHTYVYKTDSWQRLTGTPSRLTDLCSAGYYWGIEGK